MAGYIGSKASVISSKAVSKKTFAITTTTTSLTGVTYSVGRVNVFHNGIRLVDGTDYTASNGISITLTAAAKNGDQVVVLSHEDFTVANTYTTAQADATFLKPTSNLDATKLTGNIAAAQLTGALPAISGAALTGINTEPFKFVAVTGATPSLNVGTFNFFDSGSLTANTTVSFASVPTNANWKYTYKPSVFNGNSLTNIVRTGNTVAVAGSEPGGVFVSADGLYMYTTEFYNSNVNQYTMTTAYNVSTAGYTGTIVTGTQLSNPYGVFFKDDGLEMFVSGDGAAYSGNVAHYTLSTAWDVTSATITDQLNVSAYAPTGRGMHMSTDGTKLFICDYTDGDVNMYTLSTAWDVSTGTWTNAFDITARGSNPWGLTFSADGTKMFTSEYASANDSTIDEWTLSTAWDVTSATFTQYHDWNDVNYIRDISLTANGRHLYVEGQLNDVIYQFDMGTEYSITLPAAIVGKISGTAVEGQRVVYEFFTSDGGTTVNLIGEDIR